MVVEKAVMKAHKEVAMLVVKREPELVEAWDVHMASGMVAS